MSVPNTNTFSMQDVVDEIESGDDLIELFSVADASGFDPTYEGDKDRLLNFRNYTRWYIDLSDTHLNYYDTGDPYGDDYVNISSAGSWSASIYSDPGSIINSFSGSGGDGDSCTVTVNSNPNNSHKDAVIELTCGSASVYLYICVDGYADTCT